MSYIGNTPGDKYLTLEKQTFTTSATDTYNLNREVSSVNDIELFLNNVRQEPTEAYTISGTTLTLASPITASDSMYCIYQGRAVGTQSPATGSVTNAMLAGSIATSKLADITANGITEADQWRLHTDIGAGTNGVITANLERVDNNSFGYIGTGMTESSGIFSFPRTGIYLVSEFIKFSQATASGDNCGVQIQVTINNGGGWDSVAHTIAGNNQTYAQAGYAQQLVDVTDTSQVKVRFNIFSNSHFTINGSSTESQTSFTFIRLGDT